MPDAKIQISQASEDGSDPKDRRIVPRTAVSAPLSFHVVGGAVVSGQSHSGFLVDLSIAGAAVATSIELSLDTRLRLCLPRDPSKSEEGSGGVGSRMVKGVIVNARQLPSGDWRYGIKFEKLFYTLASLVTALAADHNQRNEDSNGADYESGNQS